MQVCVFLVIVPWYHFHLFDTPASFSMGWAAFMCISPNVKEEGAMKEDTGTQDTPYIEVRVSLFVLNKTINSVGFNHQNYCCRSDFSLMFFVLSLHCVGHPGGAAGAVCGLFVEIGAIRAHCWHQQTCNCRLWKKKRFQGNGFYPFCVSVWKNVQCELRMKLFVCLFVCLCLQRLSELYYDIHRSYLKVTEVVNSEKRLFGRYYRVAFYGQVSVCLSLPSQTFKIQRTTNSHCNYTFNKHIGNTTRWCVFAHKLNYVCRTWSVLHTCYNRDIDFLNWNLWKKNSATAKTEVEAYISSYLYAAFMSCWLLKWKLFS